MSRGERPTLIAMRATAALFLAFIAVPATAQYNLTECRSLTAGSATVVLAGKGERGTPLVISGRVLDERKQPVANAFVRAFHADAAGIYTSKRDEKPRLCGVARTGADGRYRFVTIKPASYPNTREPAHVHFEFWADGVDVQRDLLEFVRPLTRGADGRLQCERDLIVRRRR